MPVQWLAVALKRPLRRRIPVFYHRFVCRLLGIRVRVIGAPVDGTSAADRRQPCLLARHFDHHRAARRWCSWRRARSRAGRSSACSRSCSARCSSSATAAHKTGCGECRDRAASRRRRSGAAVRRGDGGRRQPRAAVPHRADRRGARRASRLPSSAQQVWIQPLSIAYVSQQGIPLGRHLRPRAAWYGKMKLSAAYRRRRRAAARSTSSVTWGEPIAYSGETDRKVLGRDLESAVRDHTIAALRGKPPRRSRAGQPAVAVSICGKRR